MDGVTRDNLDLSGVASASGGTYQNVSVQGVGKVHGDIECDKCVVEGVSEICGNIKAQSIEIQGRAKVRGSVTADEMVMEGLASVGGDCRCEGIDIRGKVSVGGALVGDRIEVDGHNSVQGDCRGRRFKVRGRVKVCGNVSAEEVIINGFLRVDGTCETEAFQSDGAFRIGGLLSADRITIRLYKTSSVKEMGGETIRVERGRGGHWFQRNRHLEVEMVEGDEIYLEHTKAKVVRGNNVTLGPGVQVDVVEHRGVYHNRGNNKVGEVKRV